MDTTWTTFLVLNKISLSVTEIPKFTEGIANMTIPVGREAVLTCVVEELSNYKVGGFNNVVVFNFDAIIIYLSHSTYKLLQMDDNQF